MGVYIKGMTFPKSCRDCNLEHDNFYCHLAGKAIDIDRDDERLEGCPLTEVKEPHGRLIDVDELIEFIENRYDITWESDCYEGGIKDACTDIIEEINSMPTILEAEGAEE